MNELLKKDGYEVLNLLEPPQRAAHNERFYYHIDGHWNAWGIDRAADAIADWLYDKKTLQLKISLRKRI